MQQRPAVSVVCLPLTRIWKDKLNAKVVLKENFKTKVLKANARAVHQETIKMSSAKRVVKVAQLNTIRMNMDKIPAKNVRMEHIRRSQVSPVASCAIKHAKRAAEKAIPAALPAGTIVILKMVLAIVSWATTLIARSFRQKLVASLARIIAENVLIRRHVSLAIITTDLS